MQRVHGVMLRPARDSSHQQRGARVDSVAPFAYMLCPRVRGGGRAMNVVWLALF